MDKGTAPWIWAIKALLRNFKPILYEFCLNPRKSNIKWKFKRKIGALDDARWVLDDARWVLDDPRWVLDDARWVLDECSMNFSLPNEISHKHAHLRAKSLCLGNFWRKNRISEAIWSSFEEGPPNANMFWTILPKPCKYVPFCPFTLLKMFVACARCLMLLHLSYLRPPCICPTLFLLSYLTFQGRLTLRRFGDMFFFKLLLFHPMWGSTPLCMSVCYEVVVVVFELFFKIFLQCCWNILHYIFVNLLPFAHWLSGHFVIVSWSLLLRGWIFILKLWCFESRVLLFLDYLWSAQKSLSFYASAG